MSGKISVLVAEYDPDTRDVMTESLAEWGFEVIEAIDGAEVWDVAAADDPPSIFLLDLELPEMDVAAICEFVGKQEKPIKPYIIVLTSHDDISDIEKELSAGADDYISKPLNAKEMKVRIDTAARIVKLQSQLLAVRKKIEDEAVKDSLTGVLNKRAMLGELAKTMERMSREEKPLCIALFEINEFKEVTDTHGALVSEGALRGVAKFLSRALRPYDVIGRYGGAEFMLILPDCADDVAGKICDRIKLTISTEIIAASGKALKMTLSGGVSQLQNGMEEPEEFVEAALKALEQDKVEEEI